MKIASLPSCLLALRRGLRPWRALALVAFLAAASPFQTRAALLVGSGNVTTEKREVSGFHALDLESFGSVIVTQGDSEGLSVEGEDNLLPLVQTEVDGKGVLHLKMKRNDGGVRATKPLMFKLAVKTLDRLMLRGSGNIQAPTLTVKDGGSLDVVLSGSGNVSVKTLSVGGLKVALQGSGTLTFGGSGDHQEVVLSGSGDYDAGAFKTKATDVTLSGSGDCEVWATEKLKVDIGGSGDVSYYGKPNVEKHVGGSGSVDGLGAKEQ